MGWYRKFNSTYFFGVACPIWLNIFFVTFSAIKWSIFPSSFRQSRDSNPRPRTMAQIVSPQRSLCQSLTEKGVFNKCFNVSSIKFGLKAQKLLKHIHLKKFLVKGKLEARNLL